MFKAPPKCPIEMSLEGGSFRSLSNVYGGVNSIPYKPITNIRRAKVLGQKPYKDKGTAQASIGTTTTAHI